MVKRVLKDYPGIRRRGDYTKDERKHFLPRKETRGSVGKKICRERTLRLRSRARDINFGLSLRTRKFALKRLVSQRRRFEPVASQKKPRLGEGEGSRSLLFRIITFRDGVREVPREGGENYREKKKNRNRARVALI